jgi:hypothetical protein
MIIRQNLTECNMTFRIFLTLTINEVNVNGNSYNKSFMDMIQYDNDYSTSRSWVDHDFKDPGITW